MQTQVNIVADDMGNVIRQSQNNSEYGYVRLAQKRVTYGNNGWVKNSNLSTLLLGKMEDLQALDLNANTILPGKIVIKESLEPFNSTDPDRDLKYAGDTGIVCCVDGQPIYRRTLFTADANSEDELVAHNNGQDIREANGLVTQAKVVQNATVEEAFETDNTQEDGTPPLDETDEVEEVVEELEEETFEL